MTITAYEKKAHAEIAKLLEDLSPLKSMVKTAQGENLTPVKEHERGNPPAPLKACGIWEFVKEVIIQCFGMGYDYAIQDLEGKPLKSWFTVEEAVEGARGKGYEITPLQAQRYLADMAEKRLFEYKGGKYRRRVFIEYIARYLGKVL